MGQQTNECPDCGYDLIKNVSYHCTKPCGWSGDPFVTKKPHSGASEQNGVDRVNIELRKLIIQYIDGQKKLNKEIDEAKRDQDTDAELAGIAMYKQSRIMTTQLFRTMKTLGLLDEEEIAIGCIREGGNEG